MDFFKNLGIVVGSITGLFTIGTSIAKLVNPKTKSWSILVPLMLFVPSMALVFICQHFQYKTMEKELYSSKQWHFKITRLTIEPDTSKGNTPISRFRLIFTINGQQYGYPVNQDTVSSGEAPQASWPIPGGSDSYRIAFEGYLRRTNGDAPLAGKQMVELSRTNFPVAAQRYEMMVYGEKFGTSNSKVTIDYEIVSHQ